MKKHRPSKFSVIFIITAGIITAVALFYVQKNYPDISVTDKKMDIKPPVATTTPVTKPKPGQTPPPAPKPTSINLPIPFTSQAPTANWDQLHNEACEEASAIMANAYLTGDKDVVIPAKNVEAQIASLTQWQDKSFGYHLDTTAEETAEMISGYYGLKATIVEDYTLQNIKDALNNHSVVILPVNGRLIGNPNYKQPGPIYHMLVVRGYTSADGLITNDSGTRLGQNYPYTFNTLYNAAADWDHSANTITSANKIMIVVSK
ncbi:MAG TPA: C39 family peptidase [Candidatus Limnocylindria bacterium]|nr:C39 family peptidase [Candidatus Limnocylindria bacterium]